MQKQTMMAALLVSAMSVNGAFADSSPVVKVSTAVKEVQAANDVVKSTSNNIANVKKDNQEAADTVTRNLDEIKNTSESSVAMDELVDKVSKTSEDIATQPINKSLVDEASKALPSENENTVSKVEDNEVTNDIVESAEQPEGIIAKIFSLFQTEENGSNTVDVSKETSQ